GAQRHSASERAVYELVAGLCAKEITPPASASKTRPKPVAHRKPNGVSSDSRSSPVIQLAAQTARRWRAKHLNASDLGSLHGAGRSQMTAARLKHFGWGREGEGLTAEEEAFVMARAQARFGTALKESASAPRLEDISLEPPRVTAPNSLPFCTSEHYDRVAHTYGKSYPELVRGLARDYASAPDVVAYPRNEAQVQAVLDWAGGADATVTPFGGGSSVCGGVEPRRSGPQGPVPIALPAIGTT